MNRAFARALLVARAMLWLTFGAGLGLTQGAPVVADEPQRVVLEIDSTILITRLTDATVSDGVTAAYARISLTPGAAPGLWTGSGVFGAATSSGPAVCSGGRPAMHVEGHGTYNWVAEVKVEPGIEAGLIYAAIDARDPIEEPDLAVLNYCGGSNTAMYNTWENLFTSVHQADYRPHGLFVSPWNLLATGSNWADGELIATAEWHGDCEEAAPWLRNSCTETTQFRLFAEGKASPTAPVPTPGEMNPNLGGSAPPSAAPYATQVPGPGSSAGPVPWSTAAVPAASSGGQACADLASCAAANWPVVIAGVVALALVALLGLKALTPETKRKPLVGSTSPWVPTEPKYDPQAEKPSEQRYDPKADHDQQHYDPKADKPAERYDPKADKPS